MKHVALHVQIEGAGGEARCDVIKLLTQQVMQKTGSIRAGHRDDAALGAVNNRGSSLHGALLHEWGAVVPGDSGGVNKRCALKLSGSGPGKKRRRVTHVFRW